MRGIAAAFAALAVGLAGPGGAMGAEASGGGTVRFVTADQRGPTQNNVREYNGDLFNPVEGDVWLKTDLENALIDLDANNLGSSNESGRLDLNAGQYVGLESTLGILTHRQPIVRNAIVLNGVYTLNPLTSVNYGGEDLGFKRTEENTNAWIACPHVPYLRFLVGYWEEVERGSQPLAYMGNAGARDITRQDIDRFTRDVTVGAQVDAGKGEVGYAFTGRKFSDKAPTTVDNSLAGTGQGNSGLPLKDLGWVSEQRTDIHDLAFKYPLLSDLDVAGGVSGRERWGRNNGYHVKIVDGNLGGLYRPEKDLSVSVRLYDHVMNTAVNDAFAAFNNTNPPDPRIDFYKMWADLKARYTGLKHVALAAGYKPEYNYRRNADQRPGDFGGDALYQDGLFQPDGSVFYGPMVNDTRQQLTFDADVELPADASLQAGYRFLTANRAAYTVSPTLGNDKTVAVYVPLSETVTFSTNWDGVNEMSHRSPNNYSHRLDRFLFGFQWTGRDGKASLGADYGYEVGRDRIDAYFGATNTSYLGNNINNLIHEPNSDYRYRNHVISANSTSRLPWGLVLRGDGSYTISDAHWFVTQFDPYFTGAAAGTHLTEINPTDLRITRLMVALSREVYKDVSARVSYDQEQWVDKLDGSQNGRFGLTQLAMSAKF